jgi:GT2 family glycosyltransferase/MoaA/NifB/PqqE/SkfB family radical SAM enzyme
MTSLDSPECPASARRLPTCVHFLLIDRCNAKCVFCGGDYFRARSGKAITLEKFKVIAKNLRLERFHTMVLAGAGDPLLSPDLVPMVAYAHRSYPACGIHITTNGIALTADLAWRILEAAPVKLLNLSINAASRAVYQRLMQVDRFESVIENVSHFKRIQQQLNISTLLQFSMALSRVNIEELTPLVKLAHELGVASINTFYCRFYPPSLRNLNLDSASHALDDRESLFFHQNLSDSAVTEAMTYARALGVRLTHEPLFSEPAKAQPCGWPRTSLMVGFDGEVYPCGGGELHFKNKVAGGVYNFGNALTQTIEEFWDNADYQAIRISSRRGFRRPIAECGECANLMKQDDIRSHILPWKVVAAHPLVSVIVPTYNRPDMLAEALQSILDQTYPNIEVIVVNDGGRDVGGVVAKLNSANKITYIAHDRNQGLAAARNTGIQASKGHYIAYLDDDDIYFREHLETLVNCLEGGTYSVAYTDAYRGLQIFEHDRYEVKVRDIPYAQDFDRLRMLCQNYIPVLCLMHRRTCLERAGMFDARLKRYEDWDLWIRMSQHYEFVHIKKVTCEFRCRPDGSSMIAASKAPFAWSVLNMVSKYRDMVDSHSRIQRHHDRLVVKALEDLKAYFLAPVEDPPRSGADSESLAANWFGMSYDAMRRDLDAWRRNYPAQSALILELMEGVAQRWEKARRQIQERPNALNRKRVASCGAGEPAPAIELSSMDRFKPGAQAARKSRLVSIVILTHNQLDCTRKCIAALAAHTSVPFELIVVDNASTDETVSYLENEVGERYPRLSLTMLRNSENLGYAAGNNLGIRHGRGDCVVVMNNDVVATPGWLERLLDCSLRDPRIGIVGPMTNWVSGPQRVQDIGYCPNTLQRLNEFAQAFSERHAGKSRTHWRVVGFCMLIRREVFQTIGGFDPQFGVGNFEDDDFCVRAHLAGFQARIAQDCFVHHFGGMSFKSSTVEYRHVLRTNWALFCRKWGLPAETALQSRYTISLKGIRFDPSRHYVPLDHPVRESPAVRLSKRGPLAVPAPAAASVDGI